MMSCRRVSRSGVRRTSGSRRDHRRRKKEAPADRVRPGLIRPQETGEELRPCYAGGLETLWSTGDLKADPVPFGEGLVPVTDDLLEMHKNIFAGFARDETVALGSVE